MDQQKSVSARKEVRVNTLKILRKRCNCVERKLKGFEVLENKKQLQLELFKLSLLILMLLLFHQTYLVLLAKANYCPFTHGLKSVAITTALCCRFIVRYKGICKNKGRPIATAFRPWNVQISLALAKNYRMKFKQAQTQRHEILYLCIKSKTNKKAVNNNSFCV